MEISIIGLGLIGGSIAKSLRKSAEDFSISAWDRDEVLEKALEEKVIDAKLKSPEEAIKSEVIFLCLPVDESLKAFEALAPGLNEGTLITDVCGVKGKFEDSWKSLKSKGTYIGGHPMTGKEKGGFQNSDPLLFENAVYIVSASGKESPYINKFLGILSILGARPVYLDPYVHDKVVASVSHLPQLLSVALVNTVARNSDGVNNLDFAAGGFRDMTRIASSSFNIWKDVIRFNKREIISALELFIGEVSSMKDEISRGNPEALEALFNSSRESRERIPKVNKGFITPLFYISVFIKDEPGSISRISSALFQESINIKDIELLKFREGTGGTFQIAFESESESIRAAEILERAGLDVY
ncbi:MAG: prephenate dehydrogenase/arogenate dehydrogenase family protein [Ignavibacteria bacterium]|nr:prephenate dehydrogenase/arogenate dehydrogenase family protein [Ignavibacteria bacterium]MCU7498393.1 prephenate dehydrogenase/arogenate dehydrogenase family protein [Ignavibacteria bacterium]MCU7511935.1 prephenate dehydrogenase/arogenate dehydrogenase family protein [Ignavibacteria bacterium]MCU7520032.1 prephenate dehydrogenase/arogenate dehydrogenase family protein [Ignavibacteria bacterium]MCU7523106.1 prephenate dehydrogenase/arogenate dehydrogenase family protein [Ignavibacteria bact